MAEYNQVFGIYFICDKIKVINDDKSLYYYFITVSMCPPARFYKGKENDLKFTYEVNPTKSKKN